MSQMLERIREVKADFIAFCDCGLFPHQEHPLKPVGVWITPELIDEINDRIITSFSECSDCKKTIYLMRVCNCRK